MMSFFNSSRPAGAGLYAMAARGESLRNNERTATDEHDRRYFARFD